MLWALNHESTVFQHALNTSSATSRLLVQRDTFDRIMSKTNLCIQYL